MGQSQQFQGQRQMSSLWRDNGWMGEWRLERWEGKGVKEERGRWRGKSGQRRRGEKAVNGRGGVDGESGQGEEGMVTPVEDSNSALSDRYGEREVENFVPMRVVFFGFLWSLS